tara:strand:- start:242 stop:457 length:216 start_codon:yes stop_codon:yes gene_type:complete
MQDLSRIIKIIISKEFEQNSTITLQSVYEILNNELPEIDREKRNHRVRSEIDQLRRTNKIRRVRPSTWEKI